MLKAKDIAKMIDHSLLRPELTTQDVIESCRTAVEYDTASVCVKPCDVKIAKGALQGSSVLTTTVIGFPHGSNLTEVKVFEAQRAIRDGAVELDMVMNIGRFLSGDHEYVEQDIRAVVEEAHRHSVIVKVILENCFLSDSLIEKACRICERAGCDYVKTSTGFGRSGATIEDLKLMRRSVGDSVKVKAAGGVRTLEMALAVRAAGASRFGATATRDIMDEAYQREAEGTLDDSCSNRKQEC